MQRLKLPASALPPLWVMGLTNATYGMYIGFVAAGMPILLAARHVPEARITAITAVVLTPMFWSFLLGPMLDVRFSRRAYATAMALLTAVLMGSALLNLQRLGVFEALLLLGTLTVSLSQYALGGWLVSLVAREDEIRLSAWFNVANIGGAGVMVLAAGLAVARLPLPMAALLLGGLLLLPMAVFPLLPGAGPGQTRWYQARWLNQSGESFRRFFAEVFLLLRQRKVLIALVIFVSPCAAFALTNVFAGLGGDFHAPPRFVSVVAGVGTVAAGIGASLLLPRLARWMPLRLLYLAIGVVGAVFTLSLLLLPRSATGFAVAMVGETFFQTLAITNAFAIQFEIVGAENPLASTMLAVMGSAMNLPMTYMVYLDGRMYAARGLGGSLSLDAGAGMASCVLLAAGLYWLRWRRTDAARNRL